MIAVVYVVYHYLLALLCSEELAKTSWLAHKHDAMRANKEM